MPVAGEQSHPSSIPAHQHAEAVMLDLMDPARTRGWAIGGDGRQGWMKEARNSMRVLISAATH